jgi:hypothetical protein
MNEQEMIETLRAEFGHVERVDPDGKGYRDLVAFLDRQSQNTLKMLVDAKIPWVSKLALNRWRQGRQS